MSELTKQIPADHVMLLFWVRMPHDSRYTASSTGQAIVPAKGAFKRAEEIDTLGDRNLHDVKGHGHAASGHGVMILWPSGRTREIRANS